MQSRELKRSDSSSKRDIAERSKAQLKELSLGYSKSVSYGIVESDTPSTQRASRAAKKSNKLQTPVFTIDCQADLKENKQEMQENRSRYNTQASQLKIPLERTNQNMNATVKRPGRAASSKRSDSGTLEKKEDRRGKENAFEESKMRDKERNKFSHRTPSFFNKKIDSKPPTMPSTTKATINRKEDTSSLTEIFNKTTDKPVDAEYSQRVLRGTRLQMLHVNSATATPKNYFVPKTTSSATTTSQRNSSPRNTKTPRTASGQLQTQYLTTETQGNIQPSKNSDFSFKMMYFKPIEDSKLDEFIKDVNDSHYPRKELNRTNEKSRNMTEPAESSFSTPLPSEVPLKAKAQQIVNTSKDNSIVHTEEIVNVHKKSHGGLKKSLTVEYKNSTNIIEKNATQDSHGKPPKPRSNKVKEERQSTNECFHERALSPSFESKKGLMSAEKPKVKDMNTKIESKARTTYSKLDKLLQEIKSNPRNKEQEVEVKPDPSDLEKELFGQSSKGISSSSSTNCSITKSYAHTLMKVSVNQY